MNGILVFVKRILFSVMILALKSRTILIEGHDIDASIF
jgi:hypothetical protein